MTLDLPLIWAVLLAFAVLAYVVLDGFDLGIGILFPAFPGEQTRDLLSASIAPVWDGNETWLVLGGGGLLAVFPVAYAILMPAFYVPIIVMLLGLIFRGVAFEFRHRKADSRTFWDRGFFAGSLAAAFCQGLALGTYIQGVTVADRAFAGGPLDWLTPFTVACGVGLVCGYALLGCGWLILRTEGDIQRRAYWLAKPLGALLLLGLLMVSVWTPLVEPAVRTRWFGWPNLLYLSPVPLVVLAVAWRGYLGLVRREEWSPWLCANLIFVLGFVGLGISFYPDVIPGQLTIWEAAAPDESLLFMLVGAIVLLPLILAYTAYAYWIFRGKTSLHEAHQ